MTLDEMLDTFDKAADHGDEMIASGALEGLNVEADIRECVEHLRGLVKFVEGGPLGRFPLHAETLIADARISTLVRRL